MKMIMTRILEVLVNSRFSIILLPLTFFVLTLPINHFSEVWLKVLKLGWPIWLGFGIVPLIYLTGYTVPIIIHKRLNIPPPVRGVQTQMQKRLFFKLGWLGIMLGLTFLGVFLHSFWPIILSVALAGRPALHNNQHTTRLDLQKH